MKIISTFVLYSSFLIIFLSGCSNQRNNFDTGITENQSHVETKIESSDAVEEIIRFTKEEDNASLNYLSQVYRIHISEEKPKVILDTDMTFLGDDAFCLSVLVQADNIGLIDLVGVTVTGGNSFVSVGTNAALRQLELWVPSLFNIKTLTLI